MFYVKKLLEIFYKFENSVEGILFCYSVLFDDKFQEYIFCLKDFVFNINDKNGCDDVYLKKIISYFGQLQNEVVYVISCYEIFVVYICLIRKNKINDVLQYYDDMERKGLFGELFLGYVRGVLLLFWIVLEVKVNRKNIKYGLLFYWFDYVKVYQDVFIEIILFIDFVYKEGEIQYDVNNFILMCVIKMYNCMFEKISMKLYIVFLYIIGLFDDVEKVLDKINILIDKEYVYDGKMLVEVIMENKVLFSCECKEIMIGFFIGSKKYILL